MYAAGRATGECHVDDSHRWTDTLRRHHSEVFIQPPECDRINVLINFSRYNCSFEDKIRNAQKAGFAAVIVHNVGSNDLGE